MLSMLISILIRLNDYSAGVSNLNDPERGHVPG
jgi:hypothetical protein